MTGAEFSQLIETSRPKFLVLTPCCLLPAVALALASGIVINTAHLILIFIGGLAAHVSVNMFNEYLDFTSGLDLHTERTPFSGGSGALPQAPDLARPVQIAAYSSLLVTVGIGAYLLQVSGWGLLPLGLAGIFLVYFYTQKITHWPMFCLIAPGLAFGPLMILGAYYVLSGNFTTAALSMSLIVFFLVNNLLLLNQFPDLEADRNVGRCHLPILIGRKKSAWVYTGFLATAYAVLVASVSLSLLPITALLGLLSLPLAIPAAIIAVRHADDTNQLQRALALNVAIALTTPVLVAAGVMWTVI